MLTALCKAGIRSYWYWVPKEKRIVCLYKDHCSQHIYNAFDSNGFITGLKALFNRWKNCNNHYEVFVEDESLFIKTKSGEIIDSQEISPIIYRSFQHLLKKD